MVRRKYFVSVLVAAALSLAGAILRAAGVAPRIDELAYWRSLQQQRSDLTGNSESCYDALVLKPSYRSELLSGRKTAAALAAGNYTPEQKQTDAVWIREHQDAEAAVAKERQSERAAGKSFAWAPAGYKPQDFVGYSMGNPRFFEHEGIVFKVFFEFKDPAALTPDLYKEFTERLARLHYVGDSKIPIRPGQVRFQYNNVIVHAVSVEDGKKAESVGAALFGDALAHVARGLDVRKADDPKATALDWHHFLCTNAYATLPQDAKDWVEYRD